MALVHRKAAHAACPDYWVAESSLLEVQERHRRYLELERERAGVEARLEGYEQRGMLQRPRRRAVRPAERN